MSMRITKHDLQNIIQTIEQLEKVPAQVRQVTVGDHEVILEAVDDQREGRAYLVRGITDKASGTPAYRGQQ